MAKVTIEFSRAERLPNGDYLFETTDGTQRTFASVQEVKDFATLDMETTDAAWRFALGRLLYQEPNLIPNAQNKLPWLAGKAVDVEVISADQIVLR